MAELLCTVVIVILLTQCLTVGMGIGSRAFGETYDHSKAQTLSSSLNFLIADELRTAVQAEGEDDFTDVNGDFVYKSATYGKQAKIYVSTEDKNKGQIIIETFADEKKDKYNATHDIYKLASTALYGKNLQVANFNIDPPDADGSTAKNGVFKVSYDIIKKNTSKVLTSNSFEVKYIG